MTKMPIAPAGRVEAKIEPPSARIKLTNPPLNVIGLALANELTRTLTEIESRSDISIIVFELSLIHI